MSRLWERFGDYILLIGLVLVSLMVMLSINQPMVRGLRARSLEFSSGVEDRLATAGRYLSALRENDRLRQENIQLSSQLSLAREAVLESQRLSAMLGLSDSTSGRRVAARVVSKDVTRQRNNMTIGAGREQGVREGMAVVEPRGIIGVVELVSARHALVKTYLNPGFNTPVKVRPSLSDGILSRSVSSPGLVEVAHVPVTDPVAVGQDVVTSGYSGIFRPGLPVGRIDSVATTPGNLSWRILVRPYASLSEVQHVFVLFDIPDPDRAALND